MAEDIIARAMAMDAEAGDGYTKEQVDTLLANKVDKEAGKGLSTNDYTSAEKEKLAGIGEGAEANVNADWEAESGDAQILHKPTLGAAAAKDVDSTPTASSTNVVESGGVASALGGKQDTLTTAQQAAADSGITSEKVAQYDKDTAGLADVVDGGAKNLVIPYTPSFVEGVTITRNADGSLTFVCENVTSNKIIKIGDISAPSISQKYVLSGCNGGTMQTYQIGIYDGSTNKVYQYDDAVEYTGNVSSYIIRARIVASEQTPFSGTFTVKPMLCTKAVWDVSQMYVPYCPDLQAINTWVEYECLFTDSSTVTNKFDVNNSYVKLRVNRALKRCVADISMTTIAAIDTSVTAFNIGTLADISDKAALRPRVAPRAIVWAQTGGFVAVIAKTTTTDTISFFVADGTVASGTTFTAQLSWDFV